MPQFLSDIVLPRDGDALNEAVTRAYVQEQSGVNQWTNGYGGYGNNYNFPDFVAAGQYAYLGKVGFSYTGGYLNSTCTLPVIVDTALTYRISAWVKCIGSPTYQYLYTFAYDVDGNAIQSFMGNPALFYPTTKTTLAAKWTPGQTTMTLTDGSAWAAQNSNVNRNLLIYPYINAGGYQYPDYEYSRYNLGGSARWTVSGNTLTLTNPNDPALRNAVGDGSWPAGSPIMAVTYGGTYSYPWYGTPTNSWQNVSGLITPVGQSATPWWYGTAQITLGFLLNYDKAGQVVYSGLRFEALPPVDDRYVNVTGDTMTGNLMVAPSTGTSMLRSFSGDASGIVGAGSPAGQIAGFLLAGTNGLNRWWMYKDNAAESGGNAGANLTISRYADNGNFLAASVAISRATGLITVEGDPVSDLGVATKRYVDNSISAIPKTESGFWTYDTNTTMADPGSGKVRTDGASGGSTQMAISTTTNQGTDRTDLLSLLRTDDVIFIQEQSSATNWVRYKVTATPTKNTGWYQIAIAVVNSGGTAPAKNAGLALRFTYGSGGGAGGGYLDQTTADARYVNVSGSDTMSGPLTVTGSVTAEIMDVNLLTASSSATFLGGLDANNQRVTGVGTPVGTTDATPKVYVDTRTPQITVSTTAPSSPAVGDIWVDTN